jgi:hypothetical protein
VLFLETKSQRQSSKEEARTAWDRKEAFLEHRSLQGRSWNVGWAKEAERAGGRS